MLYPVFYEIILNSFNSVQSLSHVQLLVTPWTAKHQAYLSITNSWSLHETCPSSRWCHPTISSPLLRFSSCPQSSQHQGIFKWVSSLHHVAKYWNLASTSVLPVNTQDWSPLRWTAWNLLAVQGTLKNLLQHHSSKASIHWLSAFFIVQLSHPYMTAGKTIALNRWTFVGKVMSLFLIGYLGWS